MEISHLAWYANHLANPSLHDLFISSSHIILFQTVVTLIHHQFKAKHCGNK